MLRNGMAVLALAGLVLVGAPGCENLPGEKRTQGAVAGGVAGGVAGAAMADQPLLGALIGAAAGAAGGYIIGSELERADADDEDREAAQEAMRQAENDPAKPDDARTAATADLNRDGFVTVDEVIALDRAGLSDEEIIRKLEATGQVFELTDETEDYLIDSGVSARVVSRMEEINRAAKEKFLNERISRNK